MLKVSNRAHPILLNVQQILSITNANSRYGCSKYQWTTISNVFISLLLIPFLSQAQEIQLVGSTALIMTEKNLSANMDLDTISNRQFLYAIGAIENLQGELMVFNGKPLYAGLDGKRLSF